MTTEILTPKDLVHLFVDGEINDVERTVLFRELAADAELQEYLAGAMRADQTMQQYRAAATAPDALREAVFAAAFGGATQQTAPAGFLRYGIAASIGAALLTGGLGLREMLPPVAEIPAQVATVAPARPHTAPAAIVQAPAQTNMTPKVAAQISPKQELPVGAENFSQSEAFPFALASAVVERAEIVAPETVEPNVPLGSQTPATPAYSRQFRAAGSSKDVSAMVGGFGSPAAFSQPTRLVLMAVVNRELSAGLQYNTRSYTMTLASNTGLEVNPTVSGIEAVAQYMENSDLLPLGMKPVVSAAAGYSRLGPTAFMFAGVAASPLEYITLQTGVEGNLLFYDARGTVSTAGGVRFTINAGVNF